MHFCTFRESSFHHCFNYQIMHSWCLLFSSGEFSGSSSVCSSLNFGIYAGGKTQPPPRRSQTDFKRKITKGRAGSICEGCEENMTPKKSEQYRNISFRFGIACSCFVILVFAGYLCDTFLQYEMESSWVTITDVICYLGAVICAIICLLTAVLGRRKAN